MHSFVWQFPRVRRSAASADSNLPRDRGLPRFWPLWHRRSIGDIIAATSQSPSPVAGIGLILRPLARRTAARAARGRCPGAALRRSRHRRHRRLGLPHSLWGPILAGTCLRWRRGLACAILRQCRPLHYNGRNYQHQHWQKRQRRRYQTGTEALDVDRHDGAVWLTLHRRRNVADLKLFTSATVCS